MMHIEPGGLVIDADSKALSNCTYISTLGLGR